jgi:hypothetical protein
MSELLAAPDLMAQSRSEDPDVYQSGDCWRFRWAGEDRGSFDSEQSARSAASPLQAADHDEICRRIASPSLDEIRVQLPESA